jgi:hypothetical protein
VRKKIISTFVLLLVTAIFSFNLTATAVQPKSKRVFFNRFSLEIPDGWKYSADPKAAPGTDKIQLYSEDGNRILLITLVNARDDISFPDAVLGGGRRLVEHAMSIPQFQDSNVEGPKQLPLLWGRIGLAVMFDLVEKTPKETKSIVMKVYNMGEELNETKEVLLIGALIIGEEKKDMEQIVRSLQILKKTKP